MKIKKNVKMRFVKDFDLPITILDDEYFDYYIDLYDSHYDTKKKKEFLVNTIKKYIPVGVELTDESWDIAQEAFLQDFYEIRETILKTLLSTDAYALFIKDENPIFKGKANTDVYGHKLTKKSDIYSIDNNGKFFISLDFKKANFQALKNYNKDILLGANSYEELIKKFTDLEYIKESKFIREVIFGKLNHDRQTILEQINTSKLLKIVFDENKFKEEDLKVYTNDELIFSSSTILSVDECENMSAWIKEQTGFDIRVESFELKQIKDFDYYIKRCSTGENIFKKVSAVYFPQIYKYFYSLPLNDKDLAFYYEKQIAKFIKPII